MKQMTFLMLLFAYLLISILSVSAGDDVFSIDINRRMKDADVVVVGTLAAVESPYIVTDRLLDRKCYKIKTDEVIAGTLISYSLVVVVTNVDSMQGSAPVIEPDTRYMLFLSKVDLTAEGMPKNITAYRILGIWRGIISLDKIAKEHRAVYFIERQFGINIQDKPNDFKDAVRYCVQKDEKPIDIGAKKVFDGLKLEKIYAVKPNDTNGLLNSSGDNVFSMDLNRVMKVADVVIVGKLAAFKPPYDERLSRAFYKIQSDEVITGTLTADSLLMVEINFYSEEGGRPLIESDTRYMLFLNKVDLTDKWIPKDITTYRILGVWKGIISFDKIAKERRAVHFIEKQFGINIQDKPNDFKDAVRYCVQKDEKPIDIGVRKVFEGLKLEKIKAVKSEAIDGLLNPVTPKNEGDSKP